MGENETASMLAEEYGCLKIYDRQSSRNYKRILEYGRLAMTSNRQKPTKRMAGEREYSLDALKILATVLIVFHHYQQITGARFSYLNFFGGSFYFGYLVEFFFVLSGIFMCRYIPKIEKEGMTFPQFMKRRYFRLIPMVIVGALVYEFLICIYPILCSGLYKDKKFTIWGTLLDCLGVQAGWASQNPCVNNPTWYISVLILCYIIFYFISWISSNRVSGGVVQSSYCYVIVMLIGLGITTYTISLPFLNEYTARGYFSFFFGIILGKWLYKTKITRCIWCVSIAILLAMTYVLVKHIELIGPAILTVVYYPALIVFFEYPPVAKLFRHEWISTVGKISYDVYIWHCPLFIVVYLFIGTFHWDINLDSVVSMIIFTVITFLVGTFSYFVIERHLDKVVDRYIIKS